MNSPKNEPQGSSSSHFFPHENEPQGSSSSQFFPQENSPSQQQQQQQQQQLQLHQQVGLSISDANFSRTGEIKSSAIPVSTPATLSDAGSVDHTILSYIDSTHSLKVVEQIQSTPLDIFEDEQDGMALLDQMNSHNLGLVSKAPSYTDLRVEEEEILERKNELQIHQTDIMPITKNNAKLLIQKESAAKQHASFGFFPIEARVDAAAPRKELIFMDMLNSVHIPEQNSNSNYFSTRLQWIINMFSNKKKDKTNLQAPQQIDNPNSSANQAIVSDNIQKETSTSSSNLLKIGSPSQELSYGSFRKSSSFMFQIHPSNLALEFDESSVAAQLAHHWKQPSSYNSYNLDRNVPSPALRWLQKHCSWAAPRSKQNTQIHAPSITDENTLLRHADDPNLPPEPIIAESTINKPKEWSWRRRHDEDSIFPHMAWLYLAIVGWVSFGFCFSLGELANLIMSVEDAIATWTAQLVPIFNHTLILAILRAGCAAIAYIIVQVFSLQASGSGIPELKCVLSGVYMPMSLSTRTLFAKFIGLAFSLASNLTVGRLGPYMHISAIIAAIIGRSNLFLSLKSSARGQIQAISAAIAAGVTATTGSPIGGTLLSIELMSSYYFIHWLPMSLYCAFMSYMLAIQFFDIDQASYFFTKLQFSFEEHTFTEIVLFAILGVFCGLVGAFFSNLVSRLFSLRVKYFKDFLSGLLLVIGFTFLHNWLSWYFQGIFNYDAKTMVGQLYNLVPPEKGQYMWINMSPFDFGKFNSIVSTGLFSVIRTFQAAGSLVLPIPAGTFMPIFQFGAGFGRFFGEVAHYFFELKWVDPRVFSIIGAAAVATGTLHTVSIAVMMTELTGGTINVLPLGIGCIVSYLVSKIFSADLFSELIKRRRLPLLIGLRETSKRERSDWSDTLSAIYVRDFMTTDFPFVFRGMAYREGFLLLRWGAFVYPFVNNPQEKILYGTISRSTLVSILCHEKDPTISSDERARRIYSKVVKGERIPFFENFDIDKGAEEVDSSPFEVSETTPFWKISTYFQMLGLTIMFVTRRGSCVGVLTKPDFIDLSTRARAADKLRKHVPSPTEIASSETQVLF